MDTVHLDDEHWLRRLEESNASFAFAVGDGDFSVFLYRPGQDDVQGAHGRAEIYFVVAGSGVFQSGLEEASFSPGDAIFVPAGEAHSFFGGDDVVVWAAFFGAPIDGTWSSASGGDGNPSLALALAGQPTPARIWSARWCGQGENASGPGLAVGRHMVCARLSEGMAGGVVVYRKGQDGSLRATWAHNVAEPVRPGGGDAQPVGPAGDGFDGRYAIQYTASDGAPFGPPWELEISETDGRYELSWHADDTDLRGIGVVRSGRLYAVWGDASEAGMRELSVLDLPVAGRSGAINETIISTLAAETVSRTWMREDADR